MAEAQAVIGVFRNSAEAQAVTEDLKAHGFGDVRLVSRTLETAGQVGGAGAAAARATEKEFEGIAVTEEERRHYEQKLAQGRSLVICKASGEKAREAADIMMRHGAGREEGIEAGREEAVTGAGLPKGETTIPVVEEELKVGKREVQRGGVRIYAHTEAVPVEEEIKLKEERVTVERRPVDRPAEGAAAETPRVIEVRETAEEPVVSKEARVVEEVVIGKETAERTEKIRETVKRTEVEIQQLGEEADRFGREFAQDKRYTGREWTAVEPELRRSWEERHAGTWNDVRERFQTGWRNRYRK